MRQPPTSPAPWEFRPAGPEHSRHQARIPSVTTPGGHRPYDLDEVHATLAKGTWRMVATHSAHAVSPTDEGSGPLDAFVGKWLRSTHQPMSWPQPTHLEDSFVCWIRSTGKPSGESCAFRPHRTKPRSSDPGETRVPNAARLRTPAGSPRGPGLHGRFSRRSVGVARRHGIVAKPLWAVGRRAGWHRSVECNLANTSRSAG